MKTLEELKQEAQEEVEEEKEEYIRTRIKSILLDIADSQKRIRCEIKLLNSRQKELAEFTDEDM